MPRRSWIRLTLTLLALLLNACSALGNQTTAPDALTLIPVTVTTPAKAELVICTTSEPENLLDDPAAALVWALVGMPAAGSDGTFGFEPRALAEMPTPENGGLSRNTDGTLAVTIRYREDLTWSDDQPFSAIDALLGIEVLDAAAVVRTEVVDDHTLTLTLTDEVGYPYVPEAPPLPSHVLEGLDRSAIPGSVYAERLDPALGPYVMQEWSRGDAMTFAANPQYAGTPPAFPTLRLRFLPDPDALASDLLAGNCDVVESGAFSTEHLSDLQQGTQQGLARLIAGPGFLWEHIDLNTFPTGERTPYFADSRVRQAVAHAVNREMLAQSLGLGFTTPLDSWLPPDHWAYPDDDSVLTRYGHDPDRARALLADAGWRDSNNDGTLDYFGPGGEYACQRGVWLIEEGTQFRVSLLTTAADPFRDAIAAQIQADLQVVGIGVDIQTVDSATLFDLRGPLARREFDLALFAWPAAPEPGGVNWWLGADLYRHPLTNETNHDWEIDERFQRASIELFAPSNIPMAANDFRGQNVTGWCNEAANLAIWEAASGLSLSERQAAYARQQAIFTHELPSLPLLQRLRIVAARPEICGVAPGPYAPITWNIAAWTFDPTGTCGG